MAATTTGCSVMDRFTGRDSSVPPTPAPSRAATPAPGDARPVQPSPVSAQRLTELRETTEPARTAFCDLLADDQVRAALGQTRIETLPPVAAVRPGDRVEIDLPDGGTRRLPVAEHSCRWELRTGPSADRAPGVRAAGVTVFAPAVTAERATVLIRAARSRPGCEVLQDVVAVGLPGVTTTCGPGELRTEGRVGDAWLACEITREDLAGDGAEVLLPRLLSWCGHALERVDAS